MGARTLGPAPALPRLVIFVVHEYPSSYTLDVLNVETFSTTSSFASYATDLISA
ncbi:hypothetical protein QIS74_02210 [Colletotrichum tabaci]|uniref:Uncharacterized protein n=1 Tax=Colletotrichum tabaci TaxID=1209068 RepID=A0AAV9TRC4_9PEZI